MGVLYAPETEYAKEITKWEAQNSDKGPGKRPYVYREYPMMLHKAGRPENGLGAHCIVETRVADTEQERENWSHQGFRATPTEAIAYVEAQQLEYAKLDAELNYEQKNKLSERASAEVDAARAAHTGGISHHLPAVPATTIKPRARKKTKES